MTRRASKSPMHWKQNLLLATVMGTAGVLLGCGGGGGGGNGGGGGGGVGDCGSAAGAGTVVCGYVVQSGTTTGVNGATVRLRTAAGTTVASIATSNDTLLHPGFFKITVPGGAVIPSTISVDVPSTGFLPNYVQYKGKNYDATRPAVAGGPCIPAITVTAGADTRLLDSLVEMRSMRVR